ncbi:MAG: hypothetical protein FK733_07605 [Asgard group archaeon]|nr:hypothetical protein [Asgard group archaeon]
MSNNDESVENNRKQVLSNIDKTSITTFVILVTYFTGIIVTFIVFLFLSLVRGGLLFTYVKIEGHTLTFLEALGIIDSGKFTPISGFLSIFPLLLIGIIGTILSVGIITPKDVISKRQKYVKIIYIIICFLFLISSICGFIGIMLLLDFVEYVKFVYLLGGNTDLTIVSYVLLVIFALNTIFGLFKFVESLRVDIRKEYTGVKLSNTLNVLRFEFKRVIFNVKFFVALSLVLLPAIIFLNSIARDYEAILLDFGKESFQSFSAAGFVIIAQFLIQMIAIMLTLDSFGKTANDSMKRYFALPIYKIDIYIAHMLNIIIGVAITSVLAITIFDLILWIWTGISISFMLLLKSLFLVLIGSILVVALTSFFIIVAQMFNLSSSIAIIPTLFLFYIIPFLVNFVSQFVYGLPEAYRWTFMYQLTLATDFMIQPRNGLHEIVEPVAKRNSWLVIGFITAGTEILSGILFTQSEK